MNRKRLLAFIIINECLNDDLEQLKTKRKRIWSNIDRDQQSLTKELSMTPPLEFKNRLRMDQTTYNELLDKVRPFIEKQDTMMRSAISANERLSTTLYFLASGTSYEDIKSLTRISSQSIGKIVLETCLAISKVFKDLIKMPSSEDQWKCIAKEFKEKWNFSNCIGAIGGKHVKISKPYNTALQYFNYKKSFSMVTMTIVNANYEFILVETGGIGRVPETGILTNTSFYKQLNANLLNIPEPNELPNLNDKMPYVFVGNEAFLLQANLMTPYEGVDLTEEQENFNRRLSCLTQVSENAFDILSSRFRLLSNQIHLDPQKVAVISNATFYLHNFLIRSNAEVYLRGSVDVGNSPRDIEEIQKSDCSDEEQQMLSLEPIMLSFVDEEADFVRKKFTKYFNGVGAIF